MFESEHHSTSGKKKTAFALRGPGSSCGAVLSRYIWWIVACQGRARLGCARFTFSWAPLRSRAARVSVTSTFKYAPPLWLSQTSSGGPHSSQGAVCPAPISPFLIERFLFRQTLMGSLWRVETFPGLANRKMSTGCPVAVTVCWWTIFSSSASKVAWSDPALLKQQNNLMLILN